MIRVIGIGKIKDPFYREKAQEYLLRLKKYASVEYIERSALPYDLQNCILLDEHGQEFSSVEFSKYLQKKMMEEKNITFILGPAEGFSKEVLQKGLLRISLSKMTFPNELARVVFLEQMYRACTIMKNEPYHK